MAGRADDERLAVPLEHLGALDLKLGVPSWATGGFAVTVNGVPQAATSAPGSYLTLSGNWQPGDRITVSAPYRLRVERAVDDPTAQSLFYGPLHFTTHGLTLGPFHIADTARYHAYFKRSEPVVVFGTATSGVPNRARPDDPTFSGPGAVQPDGAGRGRRRRRPGELEALVPVEPQRQPSGETPRRVLDLLRRAERHVEGDTPSDDRSTEEHIDDEDQPPVLRTTVERHIRRQQIKHSKSQNDDDGQCTSHNSHPNWNGILQTATLCCHVHNMPDLACGQRRTSAIRYVVVRVPSSPVTVTTARVRPCSRIVSTVMLA